MLWDRGTVVVRKVRDSYSLIQSIRKSAFLLEMGPFIIEKKGLFKKHENFFFFQFSISVHCKINLISRKMQINFPKGATGTGAKLLGLAGAMARAPFRGLPRTLSTC